MRRGSPVLLPGVVTVRKGARRDWLCDAACLLSQGNPAEVLALVEKGADFFDMSFVAESTRDGHALVFPISEDFQGRSREVREEEWGDVEKRGVGGSRGEVTSGATTGVHVPTPGDHRRPVEFSTTRDARD